MSSDVRRGRERPADLAVYFTLDSLLHAFPSLKLITFHQTRVIGVYNECKKYVVNTLIMMVFPSAKLVFRFRLSFNQILSPGLQLTPGFSNPLIYILFKLSIAQSCWRVMSGCRLIEISGSSGKVISFVIDSKLSIFMF